MFWQKGAAMKKLTTKSSLFAIILTLAFLLQFITFASSAQLQ